MNIKTKFFIVCFFLKTIFIPNVKGQTDFLIPDNLNIDTNYWYIQFYSNSNAQKLLSLFENTHNERLTIFHFGASHIQAEVLTSRTRELLQQEYGNAGRGLIFNYGAAKTYSSVNYTSTCSGQWKFAKSFQIPPKIPLGVMGMTVETTDSIASLDFVFKNEITADNYKLQFLFNINELTPDLNIIIDTTTYFFGETERTMFMGRNYYELNIDKGFKEIHINIIPSNRSNTLFRFYGANIEKNTTGGVMYHSLGVGAAPFESVLHIENLQEHCLLLEPDIVILDFGTNNILYHNKVEARVKSYIVEAIDKFRAINPEILIVLTSTQDLFYKRRFIDAAISFTSLVDSIAQAEDCLFWNWYDLSGGYGTIKKWAHEGYARRDHIHLTTKGYELKGYLLFKSFMNTLSILKDNPSVSSHEICPIFYDFNDKAAENQHRNSTRYRIKRGDTLSSIALKHHTTVAHLKRINNLRSDMIREGAILIIE
ncbi:MAG: LysM peptidoglycan-binding domain-containing protein [Bacteroidales bacterium]|nr:LysM peptidoglycan-binding domain-containing protein [Bacteroidales bacterium]